MKKFVTAIFLVTGAGGLSLTAVAQMPERGDDQPHPVIEKLDTNQDGEITQDEIAASNAERFASADANGDGAVDFAEFSAAAEARRDERRSRREHRMFDRMDSNSDGIISAEEHAAHSDQRMGRHFTRADADGDGVVSADELDAALGVRRERRHRRHGGGAR